MRASPHGESSNVRYAITVTIPADMAAAGTGAELRQRFRNSVGGGMRRDLQEVADEAAGGTSYPPAKEGYYVTQLTDVAGGEFSVGIGNKAGAFGFTQGYRGLQPPSSDGTKLHGWAFERGLPAFPVARRLGQWGKLDAGKFKTLWHDRVPGLMIHAAQRAYDFAVRWGNV